jgi:Trypsin-co-occurring domain 1
MQMAMLLEVPVGDGADSATLLVEVDRSDVSELTLATPEPGKAVAKATESFSQSLERLEPLLRTVKETLAAAAPEKFAVEFGIKLGGETGVILAKGHRRSQLEDNHDLGTLVTGFDASP